MAKAVGTMHNVLLKIFDYYSDYVCNETIENVETLRDDIILHENNIKNREKKIKFKSIIHYKYRSKLWIFTELNY